MAFTGKKAAIWKVAYINAFNTMAEELQQIRALKNSFKLIEPPTITHVQAGEIITLVGDKTRATGKHNAYFLTRFKNHFKLSSYKLLPAERFAEAMEFLRRLEGDTRDSFVMLSHKELNALTLAHDVKTLDPPQADTNSITLTLMLDGTVQR
jgi:hypothetical protein